MERRPLDVRIKGQKETKQQNEWGKAQPKDEIGKPRDLAVNIVELHLRHRPRT